MSHPREDSQSYARGYGLHSFQQMNEDEQERRRLKTLQHQVISFAVGKLLNMQKVHRLLPVYTACRLSLHVCLLSECLVMVRCQSGILLVFQNIA